MSNFTTEARRLYDAGEYQNALREYLHQNEQSPSDVDTLIMIGNCYDKLAQKDSAVQWYKKACKQDKHNILALSNYATSLYENKDYEQAEKIAHKVLKLDSQNTQALINLGNIEYLHKNYDFALNYYQQAYDIKKENSVVCVNLANTYFDLKQYAQAISYAKEAIKSDSSQVMAWNILGNSEFELENFQAAQQAFTEALKLDSQDYWLHNYLSQVYQKMEQWSQAYQEGWQALQLSNGEDSQQVNFGYLLYESSLETADETLKQYARRWLNKYPENKIVRHMANAVLNKEIPARANNEYLQNIFDTFAPDFEQVLSALDYQAPTEIKHYLQNILGQKPHTKFKILDAGCGTGLCGEFLKSYSKIFGLYGVDISEKMLEEAKKKNLYHKLYCDELEHFFANQTQHFDMVVSADVFTYFGDLSKVISGVSKCLTPKGRFIFTVSENSANDKDYFLHASGRYLHSQKYIENLLITNCFCIEKIKRCKLRNEGKQEVFGYLFSALKND